MSKPSCKKSLIFAVLLSYIARKNTATSCSLVAAGIFLSACTDVITSIPSPSDFGTAAFWITSPSSDNGSNSETSSLLLEILSCLVSKLSFISLFLLQPVINNNVDIK